MSLGGILHCIVWCSFEWWPCDAVLVSNLSCCHFLRFSVRVHVSFHTMLKPLVSNWSLLKWSDFDYFLLFTGAIELAILSDYYGREIAAYDIQTKRCDIYGQVSTTVSTYFVYYIWAGLNETIGSHFWLNLICRGLGLSSWEYVLLNHTCRVHLPNSDTFLSAPTSSKIRNTCFDRRWLADPNHAHSYRPHNFRSTFELNFLSKWRFLCSWSGHIGCQMMLILEPRQVGTFLNMWFNLFKHMVSFWCLFLDPHLTTYHSNTGAHIIAMLELGTCTLGANVTTGRLICIKWYKYVTCMMRVAEEIHIDLQTLYVEDLNFDFYCCNQQDKGYSERVMLIYDGLHYDALAVSWCLNL